jgi:GxxExxY protein
VPIRSQVELPRISQEEMRSLDYQVMAHAFASQNELGRLCDESVYQKDLAARLITAGLGPVLAEYPIEVCHADFTVTYRCDLVVSNRVIYELKTSSNLAPEHQAQLLNYLFLTNTTRGKLINFRPQSVASRFTNTTLDEYERHRIDVNDRRWSASATGHDLQALVLELLNDWGLFLELALYNDAIIHFLGGIERVISQVPMSRSGIALGNQQFLLAAHDTAFQLTAFTENLTDYEDHLSRILRHSPLSSMHWINMNHHLVQFVTLAR